MLDYHNVVDRSINKGGGGGEESQNIAGRQKCALWAYIWQLCPFQEQGDSEGRTGVSATVTALAWVAQDKTPPSWRVGFS